MVHWAHWGHWGMHPGLAHWQWHARSPPRSPSRTDDEPENTCLGTARAGREASWRGGSKQLRPLLCTYYHLEQCNMAISVEMHHHPIWWLVQMTRSARKQP